MSKKISTKKAGLTFLNVIVSYSVSYLALYLTQKVGLSLTDDQQGQIVIAVTAGLSGAIAGLINWGKHNLINKTS